MRERDCSPTHAWERSASRRVASRNLTRPDGKRRRMGNRREPFGTLVRSYAVFCTRPHVRLVRSFPRNLRHVVWHRERRLGALYSGVRKYLSTCLSANPRAYQRTHTQACIRAYVSHRLDRLTDVVVRRASGQAGKRASRQESRQAGRQAGQIASQRDSTCFTCPLASFDLFRFASSPRDALIRRTCRLHEFRIDQIAKGFTHWTREVWIKFLWTLLWNVQIVKHLEL